MNDENKYSRSIEKNKSNDSLSEILNYIQPNSNVLEFGCASGYFTKYLTEEINCNVYIVEMDEEYFNSAIEYAKDGVCCDAASLVWLNKFANLIFDYILFADVLEHMTHPFEVLNSAKDLLSSDGCIIISAPNVCHADVILNMYLNKFSYTRLGLLDDSHVHFFSYNSLKELCLKCELEVVDEKYTTVPIMRTEQSVNPEDYDSDVIEIISSKKFADVYQFIFQLCKKKHRDIDVTETVEKNSELKVSKEGTIKFLYETIESLENENASLSKKIEAYDQNLKVSIEQRNNLLNEIDEYDKNLKIAIQQRDVLKK